MPAQEVDGLVDEDAQGRTAILLPWRDDLDHGDGTSQMELDDNAVIGWIVPSAGVGLQGAAHDVSWQYLGLTRRSLGALLF